MRCKSGTTPKRAIVLEKEEEHKVDTWWRRSSGGEDISGEAIAAEEEVSTRTMSMLKGMEERMVEAVIVTEEECKEVPSCTRATEPEATTHSYIVPQLSAGMDRKPAMLKPFLIVYGTSTSYSVRDGLLPVHPLVLHNLPATLRASTLTMMKYTPNSRCVRRMRLLSFKAPAGQVLLHRAPGPFQRPHLAFAPLAAVAHSSTPAVEEAHHEARQKGNRNPAG